MGNVLKLNLLFRERFWETVKLWDEDARPVDFHDAGFFHFPGAPLPTWWTQLPIRAPLLVGWTGGPQSEPPAVAGGPALLAQAIDSLSTIFNLPAKNIRDQLAGSYIHDWRDDPFSRGAYAYEP